MRHVHPLSGAVSSRVVGERGEEAFRVEQRGELVGGVVVVMRHAADRVGHLDAVAHAVECIAGAIVLGIDIGGLAIVEVILHPHHALIGGTGGVARGDHVADRVVHVFGAHAVRIDLGGHAAAVIVFECVVYPDLAAGAAALQQVFGYLVADFVIRIAGDAAFRRPRFKQAVGQVVGIDGGARRGCWRPRSC